MNLGFDVGGGCLEANACAKAAPSNFPSCFSIAAVISSKDFWLFTLTWVVELSVAARSGAAALATAIADARKATASSPAVTPVNTVFIGDLL
jgi:hypothetical protein